MGITGVLVEKVTNSVREDKDFELGHRLAEVFDQDEMITWNIFNKKMETKVMKDLFVAMDVDPSEAFQVFELLDADGSGNVDKEEILSGVLKLRGPAKALEVILLLRWVHELVDMMKSHQYFVMERLS